VSEQISRAEALEKSTNLLREEYKIAKLSDITMGSLLVAFPKGFVPEFDQNGDLIRIFISQEDMQDVQNLLVGAKKSQEDYDALVAWAAAQLLNKRIIPNREVERFLISHLLGRNTRPTKMGRPTKRSGYMYRHANLRLAVAEIEREGFKRTRNDEAEHRKSACDIVAEAMVALGYTPRSYKEIEKILSKDDRVG
jgi:hypothetical protein